MNITYQKWIVAVSRITFRGLSFVEELLLQNQDLTYHLTHNKLHLNLGHLDCLGFEVPIQVLVMICWFQTHRLQSFLEKTLLLFCMEIIYDFVYIFIITERCFFPWWIINSYSTCVNFQWVMEFQISKLTLSKGVILLIVMALCQMHCFHVFLLSSRL